MSPTMEHGDSALAQTWGYQFRRGDIVVVSHPFREVTGLSIKRVVAVGGQTVEIDYAANTVSVDGVTLDEPYRNAEPMQTPWYENATHVTVPEGELFLLGDNRNHSDDSRDILFGCVKEEEVVGKVIKIIQRQ